MPALQRVEESPRGERFLELAFPLHAPPLTPFISYDYSCRLQICHHGKLYAPLIASISYDYSCCLKICHHGKVVAYKPARPDCYLKWPKLVRRLTLFPTTRSSPPTLLRRLDPPLEPRCPMLSLTAFWRPTTAALTLIRAGVTLSRHCLRSGRTLGQISTHKAHLDAIRDIPHTPDDLEAELELFSDLSDLTPSDADDDDATPDPDCPNASVEPEPPTNNEPSRSQKRKARFKARRSVKRQRGCLATALENPALPPTNPMARPPKAVAKKRLKESKPASISVGYDTNRAAHTSTGWTGLLSHQDATLGDVPEPHVGEAGLGPGLPQEEVDQLAGDVGFTYVAWLETLSIPILDAQRRVVALLGGPPGTPAFRWVNNEFMTNADFDATASPKDHLARAERARERWQKGLSMFSVKCLSQSIGTRASNGRLVRNCLLWVTEHGRLSPDITPPISRPLQFPTGFLLWSPSEMGRTQKLKSDEEKRAANALKCKIYRQTPAGKLANRKHKRKSAKNAPLIAFPALSKALVHLASLPLPREPEAAYMAFADGRDGIIDVDFIANCNIGAWAKRPPFPPPQCDLSDRSRDIEVLAGWVLGIQVRDEPRMCADWKAELAKSPRVARAKLREELYMLLSGFEALTKLDYVPGAPMHTMVELWMRLDARKIQLLHCILQ
ncbi:hypothetical protein GGX14DRAFT_557800 [Mycena pura]|uniref:Uncharacterized protein n=1 Tax=Mycena pura TaxID=153505 RepID=A0AAD7E0Z2_9AGAR|nr:hypothetical protein GGX14DRAFT_557800 [Mycena pura]